MTTIQGLPPLPKSLSGLLTFAGRRDGRERDGGGRDVTGREGGGSGSGGAVGERVERFSPPVKPSSERFSPVRADSRTESRMDSRPESARSHYSGVGYGASAFEPYYANGSIQGFSPRSSPRSHSSSPRNQSGGSSGGNKSHSPRGSPPVPGSISGNNPRLSPAHVSAPPPPRQRRPSNLDSQLAVLRKEMVRCSYCLSFCYFQSHYYSESSLHQISVSENVIYGTYVYIYRTPNLILECFFVFFNCCVISN